MNKKWTPEDYEKLREGWGNMNGGVPALAASMGRSVESIKIKANKLRLGPWLDANEFLTLNMLFKSIFGGNYNNSYNYNRLLRLGLPVTKRLCITTRFRVIRISDFWKWAEAHQQDLDFANFEEGALGLEPGWVNAKRTSDRENKRLVLPKKSRWSPQEDSLLQQMCEKGTTWAELEDTFRRSSCAIRRRIYDLRCATPIRSPPTPWTQDELETVKKLSLEGYSIDYIARHTGKTGQSIRGKLEWLKKQQM